MHELTAIARFAHVFPKYQNNPRWVRSFLEVFERAGEDAMVKAHQAFRNLSKNKRFTVEEREAARKFAESLSLMVDPPVNLPASDLRILRDLFARLSG